MKSSGQQNRLLFLCYGKGAHLYETLFSTLTLRRFAPGKLEGTSIHVMTDEVEFFEREGFNVLPLSARTIEEWKGPAHFPHRCKIKAFQQVMAHSPGKWILVDGDTHFIRPPAPLFDRVGPGRSVMHMIEGPLSNSRHEFNRRLGEILEDRTPGYHPAVELAKGRSTVQWNAGVVGLDSSDAPLLEGVLGLTDHLLSKLWAITGEQVSFSAVLAAKTRIRPTRDVIFHYNVSLERDAFAPASRSCSCSRRKCPRNSGPDGFTNAGFARHS